MENSETAIQWKTRITEILGSPFPVILGPMRKITLGRMAAAVSKAGGLGVIAASGLSSDELRAEIEDVRSLTGKPFAVNIPIYRPNAREALEIAIEMGVGIIYTSAGDPAAMVDRSRSAGLKILHKVSNVKLAKKAEAAGVDGIVAMGWEAGGHIGREQVSTFCLIPQIVDAVSIPVIASGGIGDARGLLAAFALGAEGVELGTRFLATREAPIRELFKNAICAAECGATEVLGKDAMPIRVLKMKAPSPVGTVTGDAPDDDEQDGGTAVISCGQIAGLIREVTPVDEIMSGLTRGVPRLFDTIDRIFREEKS